MSHSCVCDTFNTDADMNNDGYRIQLFSCFSDKRESKKKKKGGNYFPLLLRRNILRSQWGEPESETDTDWRTDSDRFRTMTVTKTLMSLSLSRSLCPGETGKPDNFGQAWLASLTAGTVKFFTARHDTRARVPLHFMVWNNSTVAPLFKDHVLLSDH